MAVATFTNAFSQFNEKEWQLSFGINAIADPDSDLPGSIAEGFTMNSIPLSAGVQYNITEDIAIEQMFGFNKFSNDIKDSGPLEKKYYYFSSDTHVKYNWGQLILNSRRNSFELTVNAGLGFYQIEDTHTTLNFGGGVLWWLTEDKSFGLRLQTLGKFGKRKANEFISQNYWHHNLQFVIALN